MFDLRDPSFYNPLINSNFTYWQRPGVTNVTRTTGGNFHDADKWSATAEGPTAKSITITRQTTGPSASPFLVDYTRQVVNNTAVSSFAALDAIIPAAQFIEGSIFKPFYGQSVTFGMWVFSSVGGVFPVSFRRTTQSRSYVTTVTLTANVWQYVVCTIPYDTVNTAYTLDTGLGITVTLGGVGHTAFHTPTLNQWVTGEYWTHSSVTNWAAVSGATLIMAQPQIRLGTLSATQMQNSYRRTAMLDAEELRLCQRYYEVGPSAVLFAGACTSGQLYTSGVVPYKVSKRTTPAVTLQNVGVSGFAAAVGTVNNSTDWGFTEQRLCNGTTTSGFFLSNFFSNAEF